MIGGPSNQDYYQILEVAYDATPEEIKSAYERARELYSTESSVTTLLLSPEERRRTLEQITDAYHTLIAEDSRRLYDHSLAERSRDLREKLSHRFEGSEPASVDSGGPPSASPSSPVTTGAPLNAATAPSETPSYPRLVTPRDPPSPAGSAKSEPPPSRPGRSPITLGVKEEASGAFLKKAREAAGVDLRSISDETKIGVTMLGYIEDERLDRLPADVYLKNFVKQYAQFLGLDSQRVARSFVARVRRLRAPSNPGTSSQPDRDKLR